MKAMHLLGINCGFGNSDCGNLPTTALDLDAGWLDYPRPKTGINRRCPLWPETVSALREAQAERPTPKKEEHAGLFFITKYGGPWAKDTPDSPITKETRKLLDRLGVNGHRNYYTLRHTFRTVRRRGEGPARRRLHHGPCTRRHGDAYRERISDDRLKVVADYVRWRYGAASPFFFFRSVHSALVGSVIVTLVALLIFGYIRGTFATARPFRSAWQTVIVGGLAATAAFVIAKAIG